MVNILDTTEEKCRLIFVLDYKVLLGEMQLSFVCLLMAQNFSGFNQWKQLVQLLCSCPQLIQEKPDMFVEFMGKKRKIGFKSKYSF
jgi:A1 cistron-splicing factor AAR2